MTDKTAGTEPTPTEAEIAAAVPPTGFVPPRDPAPASPGVGATPAGTAAAAPAPPPDPAEPAPPHRRRGGLAALVLGGMIAAALGFGAAWLVQGAGARDLEALAARIDSQNRTITELTARLDALPPAPDLSPLQSEIADLRADLVAQTDGLRPGIAALDQRLAAVERAPAPDGTLSQTALAAWQGDIDALRAGLAAQSDRIDALAAEGQARLAATAEDIAGIEAQTTAAFRDTARRAALAQVLAALESGAPFDDALATIDADAAVVPTLIALADGGAPTLTDLRTAFPDAARSALAAARAEGLSGEDGGGFLAFLRSQFNVRSTVPREGASADATLSRAEAALADADLDAALTEIATLPEVVRGAMGAWLALAQTRQAALNEAAALAATLNQE